MTTFAPLPARLDARLAALTAAAITLALASPAARAQTTVTLDGTSGSNSISTSYTLSGDTTFDLGFFVDSSSAVAEVVPETKAAEAEEVKFLSVQAKHSPQRAIR